MTQTETIFALLGAAVLLSAWLLLRSFAHERGLQRRLAEALSEQLDDRLAAQHREILRDLHEGLARQTDRIGEHARADRDLLQRGLSAASLQLSRGMQALTQSVDGRLDTLSGQVSQRLDEGFRKTNETFASVMARLATIDEAQKKIDGLTTNVVSLQELLGDKRARGAFGEVQLEALVQNALPPDAYAFQQVLPNGTRVDCLLTLPAPTGKVAVDAKFPLENYHRMFDADAAELDRRAAQQAFRTDVKRHVDAIAGKYILPGTTSDGAVLFLPAEAVFAEIHAYHPEVVAYAQHKRVWIVSPTTLMAVLNTARAVLKDVETRKQIHVIQDALAKLAKDFQRFDERMAALARHIEQASRDVQDVHTSSRKISAHFHKIESAQLDELADEAGAQT
ncbi:DNA recombination protein RmuC [Thauera chlorobenzoica]|uniref:DNA recombination protein RmuC n=1 Tax=Thauera chlorobenzoica TaxID=96773 RepID=A0A1H5RPY2_9RHOO|nr:DNA recombination protein RmuC [Thauera chlorobenzoica]APR05206.1 DNA recombination protein RmuC [Thauera chlorobenzoica]SEF40386.1 DNA recombination protein RmuC [Thauera chlorobenzoica]